MPISKTASDKLLQAHGLDPVKNTDADVENYILNDLITEDDLADLENRAALGDAAQLALVETDLAKYANRIGKKPETLAHWKQALLTNRKVALEMLEDLNPAPAVKSPLHNRKEAGTPDSLDKATDDAASKQAQAIGNRAAQIETEARASGRTITPMGAFLQAQSEIEGAATK